LAKEAIPFPPLLTVMVQLNEAFGMLVPLTLLDFVAVRSAIWRLTVWLAVLEVTPLIVAEALLVTKPAVTSAAVTV
jgi:hypothetical protein